MGLGALRGHGHAHAVHALLVEQVQQPADQAPRDALAAPRGHDVGVGDLAHAPGLPPPVAGDERADGKAHDQPAPLLGDHDQALGVLDPGRQVRGHHLGGPGVQGQARVAGRGLPHHGRPEQQQARDVPAARVADRNTFHGRPYTASRRRSMIHCSGRNPRRRKRSSATSLRTGTAARTTSAPRPRSASPSTSRSRAPTPRPRQGGST